MCHIARGRGWQSGPRTIVVYSRRLPEPTIPQKARPVATPMHALTPFDAALPSIASRRARAARTFMGEGEGER